MDQNDVELGLDDAVHVDVHHDVEAVVHVGPHEGEDELEDLRSDVELHLADVDPLEGRHEVHRLRLRQYKLPVEHADAEGLKVNFHEQLHNQLEHGTDFGQDLLLAADKAPSGQQLGEDEVELVDLELDGGDFLQELIVVGVVAHELIVFLVLAGLSDHLDSNVFLLGQHLVLCF